MQALKNNLNEEDLTELVKHIKDIKDLSSRNKELEDENARLKQEVERLRLGRIVKVDSEEAKCLNERCMMLNLKHSEN